MVFLLKNAMIFCKTNDKTPEQGNYFPFAEQVAQLPFKI